MKLISILFIFISTSSAISQEQIDYVELSQELLTHVKNNQEFTDKIDLLSATHLKELTDQLKNDDQKKAFWINIYNAFIQISLSENPDLFKPDHRSDFFSQPRINIAGEQLSFDDIEHGIIRKSRVKWSLGYLRKWFRPKWERKLRVDKVDWRIHFALNCGAISCPPIAIYSAEQLDQELDYMSKTYLEEQTTYDENTKTAKTVALMSWFRGDFGGKSGAKTILKTYEITPVKPKHIEFKNYDWTMSLGNFKAIKL